MRLILTNSNKDLFVQGEWVDNAGSHTRRLSEDMPAEVKAAAQTLIDWADGEEKATYAPMAEGNASVQRLEQEIARLQGKLAVAKAAK
ncbi:MAG: hypothetical protein M0R06_26900 [Sphaerochaeta sp.]|jgi:polyhydroxyalkanoate synthesis regulator phasin|nr:hypothetical protein [Sphaerochaeta sp.]